MFQKGKEAVRKAVKSLSKSQAQELTQNNQMAGGEGIDESLYSRQLYVMGHEAQRRMGASKVLIYGLNGLGVEVAKNVILAGVKAVTLMDSTPTKTSDLGSQFYLTEADVGKPRAEACVNKLRELNAYVQVDVAPASASLNDENFLKQFSVVLMTQGTLTERMEVNRICHANKVCFVYGRIAGVFAQAFCDFGENFVVSDTDGEQPKTCIVASVSKDEKGLVAVHDDSMHGLQTGDYVKFTEVQGMVELNKASEPFKVTVTGPFTFEIGDTSKFGTYTQGGLVTQVKVPVTMSFLPLEESMEKPEIVETDFGKIGRPQLLHAAFKSLDSFYASNKRYPEPGNGGEIATVLNGATESYGETVDGLNKFVIESLASGSSASLSPMAAFLGGVLGQEVLKACSGKFSPLHQWMYFDALECLPDELPSAEALKAQGSRYDDQIAVFGSEFVKKVREQSVFLVGAGAIGCEMLKNWACMGIATANKGDKKALIHVTDMDSIEKSNLNRQFLFRPSDVGKAKSTAAGAAVAKINPEINVKTYEEKVAPETEDLFGDDFMENIDAICTALDNVNARLYVDQRCLAFEKPMLESGTLGTKGNTQIVVPHLTENYGASRDPPEKTIPVCTLHHFPNRIEHTIQFARDTFMGEFTQRPENANQYIKHPDYLKQVATQQNERIDILQNLHKSLVSEKPVSFDDCIAWARLEFEREFSQAVKQLLYNFPPGSKTSTGGPFWSGAKRQPDPLVFDANDPTHMSFIVSAANLRAFIYGLTGSRDVEVFKKVLPTVAVPEFRPKNVKIAENDSELKAQQESGPSTDEMDVDTLAGTIEAKLPDPKSLVGMELNAVEFEKDDDSNFHMDFITAASNLRARCYKIEEADLHRTKQIAGKIIPAIATTTALVTGLVCLEFYKIIAGKKSVESYKNGFVNLALPLFAFSEPIETPKSKLGDWEWSIWDKIVVDGSQGHLTLKQFLKHFTDKYNVDVNMMSHGVSILHSFFQSAAKTKKRMKMTMPELITEVTKKPVDPSSKFLSFELCCVDEEGEDVDMPPIFYKMPVA